jgi:hypothetical protein
MTSLRRLAIAIALATAACGSQDGLPDEPLGAAAAPIAGGVDDAKDTAVLSIVDSDAHELCTGTLIAPNVVLTARHCVADLENLVDGTVECGKATFGAPHAAHAFLVSAAAVIDQGNVDQYDAKEVIVPEGDASVCGADVAVLILTKNVDAKVATPVEPLIAASPAKGSKYAAVGYGNTSEQGTDSGSRRRKDGLAVECLGDACPDGLAASNEWSGDTSLCSGDSGGPAIDGSGRIVGVASRSGLGCVTPVYADLSKRSAWLVASTKHGATVGGYTAPAWTEASVPPDPTPDADAGTSGGSSETGGPAAQSAAPTSAYGKAPGHGCSVVAGQSGGAAAIAWAGAAIALAAARRRAARAGR